MDLPENSIHSFVIKIWLEETVAEADRAAWRGHITHVASGERRHVQRLADFPAFIAPYLRLMEVDVNLENELRLWLEEQRAD